MYSHADAFYNFRCQRLPTVVKAESGESGPGFALSASANLCCIVLMLCRSLMVGNCFIFHKIFFQYTRPFCIVFALIVLMLPGIQPIHVSIRSTVILSLWIHRL